MTDHARLADAMKKPMEPRVFVRADSFYIVDIYPGTEADNAHCNPGTIRVEDVRGNVLWRVGQEQ